MLKIQQNKKKMKKYIAILQQCELFKEMNEEEILKLLNCLQYHVKSYHKDQVIFQRGASVQQIGIVLSGSVQISSLDYKGNRSIQALVMQNELFAETFACASVTAIHVDVIAKETSEILFIHPLHILSTCPNQCSFHAQLIYRLMNVIANKNLLLQQKIRILSKRSIRERLLYYLYDMANRNHAQQFYIPFNRNELADYLECDRSGLSALLSKLKAENIIDYHKNYFVIK